MVEISHRTCQMILGGGLWAILFCGATVVIQDQYSDATDGITGVSRGIFSWAVGADRELTAVSDVNVVLAAGDPIFLQTEDGQFTQVGFVRNHLAGRDESSAAGSSAGDSQTSVLRTAQTSQVSKDAHTASPSEAVTRQIRIVIDQNAVDRQFRSGFELEYHTTPSSLNWVGATMFHDGKRQQIVNIIARDWAKHRIVILQKLRPVMESGIRHIIASVESELPDVLREHEAPLSRLSERYQAEVFRKEIVPLARQEILPIIQQEVTPLAQSIGTALWDRVSLWSFTWRILYDASPLPQRNAVRMEFDRFLREEVNPAVAARSDEFVAVTERILRRASRNPEVQRVVSASLRRMARDPELQTIIWSIVRGILIDNQALQTALDQFLESPEVREAMAVASASFEPTVREIGDTLFGSRETGVSPEFAQVLRVQILMKDRRWLVVVPQTTISHQRSTDEPVVMRTARARMRYPIEFEGTEQSPLTPLTNESLEMNIHEP